MGLGLALLSALSYGTSDVVGGLASRRIPYISVALIGQVGGLCATAVVLLATPATSAVASDVLWGAGSGVGTGIAMTFLFRGLGRGAMSVVVPLGAVGGVTLPVLVSVALLGERPPGLTWVGIAIALPALWFISRGMDGDSLQRTAAGDGLAASGGIALQYLCLAQASASSELWPILSGRAAAIVTVLALAVPLLRNATSRRAVPRSSSAVVLSIGAGALAAAALAAYLYALRTEYVAVTVVLSSLYPVVPVVVGLLILRERLHRSQAFGLAAALFATALIAVA